ncbi:MAG TPA: hypothetical protein PKV13_05065 [Propionicimonas sp.]|nr:hypothetical protein [Propionicimonas sp.]HRA05972.1 hypothetical protein [Propionicimonas sp.]
MKRYLVSLAALALTSVAFWAPTPVAAQAAPLPAADNASALVVATYNVRCANCSKHPVNKREKRWNTRAAAITDAIKSEGIDLLGVQEASSGVLWRGGPSQFEDLVNRLGSPYALTNAARYNCVRSSTPTRCDYSYQGASGDTRIIYNTNKLDLLAQGSLALDDRLAGNGSARFMAWAKFSERATGKQFYFASAHLEPGMSGAKVAKRGAQANAAIAELDRVSEGLPVIWGSDLASSKLSHSGNTAYEKFMSAGYTDPLGNYYKAKAVNSRTYAASLVNEQYFTLNNFAKKPKRYSNYALGAHLDYILLKPQMQVLEWEQVLRLTDGGKFAGTIPSDHNMVKVTLVLP